MIWINLILPIANQNRVDAVDPLSVFGVATGIISTISSLWSMVDLGSPKSDNKILAKMDEISGQIRKLESGVRLINLFSIKYLHLHYHVF